MKVIMLHDRYNNEPVVIRVDAINAIIKLKNGEEEYSELLINDMCEPVKETIDVVMNKIQETESDKESDKE